MTFDEWINLGLSYGYCSEPYCQTHDGISENDNELWESLMNKYGEEDYCWTILKVYIGDDSDCVNK